MQVGQGKAGRIIQIQELTRIAALAGLLCTGCDFQIEASPLETLAGPLYRTLNTEPSIAFLYSSVEYCVPPDCIVPGLRRTRSSVRAEAVIARPLGPLKQGFKILASGQAEAT